MNKMLITILLLIYFNSVFGYSLPPEFVYLKSIDPTIQQDIRYAGSHNFIGRPINGYSQATCILTKPAALALQRAAIALKSLGLGLKVFDCYRPQRAVDDFLQWSQNPAEHSMKAEFYPRVDKDKLFDQGYIAARSGHSRGSTVDLTIIPLPNDANTLPSAKKFQRQQTKSIAYAVNANQPYHQGMPLITCYNAQRYSDGGLDMGTGFDCLDPRAHIYQQKFSPNVFKNRRLLQNTMKQAGFYPYSKEWWHFTLRHEPYPETYFNFMVQ